MNRYIIYTDGACSGNPGVGGWAAIISLEEQQIEISGRNPSTTNNQMELQAVIEGLKTTPEGSKIEVNSDSAYVVNAFLQGWISKWKQRDWHTSDNKKVANKTMWLELLSLIENRDVKFVKVAGHADNELNNRCDLLAKKECVMIVK